jgi:thioesterase domain-containing protein
MHLISGKYPEVMYQIPEDYGWTEKVSNLTTVQIPGGHNTIFSRLHLPALRQAFHEALAE